MRIRTQPQKRPAARGNALIEYAVPMVIILVSAGVIATITDIDDLLAEYFMAASGHTQADLSGSTFRVRPMSPANVSSDDVGNGFEAFNSYGTLLDGAGGSVSGGGSGIYFVGPVVRNGARPAPSSSEYLYADSYGG